MNGKYGYKVCYRTQGSNRLKVYLVTNTYDGAIWNVRWYENHSPPDRKTNKPIENVIWLVIPINTYIEFRYRWRGCPF
jgi:hypothetical protein